MATICSFTRGKNYWADVSIILNAIIAVSGSLEGAGRFIYNLVSVSHFFEHDTIENILLILDYQEYISIIKSYPSIKKVAMTFPSLWENSLSHTIWAPVGNCTYLLQGKCQKAEYTFDSLPKSHVTHAQIWC